MAYYDALKAKWATAPAGTTQQKLDWVNAQTVVGAPIRIAKFARYQLGEGIDRKDGDFAAEVAKAAGKR